jgi:phage regulator Rha-like protein
LKVIREIAELTGKRHDNILADIKKMLVELHGEGGLLNFQQSYITTRTGICRKFASTRAGR